MTEREELMAEQATPENNNKQLNWTTEMKIDVPIMDKEERAKGRGFMKRVKERWDQKYPEYQQASWQKLRDNEARFKKEPELMSLILVRQREVQPQDQEQQQEEEEEQTEFKRVIVIQLITRRNKLGIISRWLNKSNYPKRSSQRKTRILRQCLSPS